MLSDERIATWRASLLIRASIEDSSIWPIMERCQTGERQLGEWILANGRMEKTGYGQMEEWYDHLSNICSQCQ